MKLAQNGFTLVELIVVMGIVGIISSVVVLQIGNEPKNRARDDERKVEVNTIADSYVTNAVSDGIYRPLSNKVPKPPEGGDYQGLLSVESEDFKVCAVLEKGKDINCLENSNNPNCYCRSSHTDNGGGNEGYNNGGGNGGNQASPTPVASPTLAPTPAPTPSNPWGQAANFAGKVAGLNAPSYTPILEFVRAGYDSKMNLTSPNVTVEAWIKPNPPINAGYQYRIVDNTFRLTMVAQPNGQNTAYQYYFDVQSSTNGCGQTVVYSGNAHWNPWEMVNYKTVTPAEFGNWKHVAGVLHNGNLKIYENGVLLNSYNIGMSVCNDGRAMHVGAGLFGKNTPYYDFFQGLIDEVRVSKTARYTGNFTPSKTPFTSDANTMVLYHFDGNTNDASSNNLNGTITGGVDFVNSDIPY